MVHGPHDEFESDSSSASFIFSDRYDRRKIYGGASDIKGHSSYMRVYIPKPIAAVAADLAASRLLDGIRQPQDMYRDALVHRLHDYNEMINDPLLAADLLAIAERERALANVEKVLAIRQRDEEACDRIMRLIRETGISYLETATAAASAILTPEFRERALAEIERYKRMM